MSGTEAHRPVKTAHVIGVMMKSNHESQANQINFHAQNVQIDCETTATSSAEIRRLRESNAIEINYLHSAMVGGHLNWLSQTLPWDPGKVSQWSDQWELCKLSSF